LALLTAAQPLFLAPAIHAGLRPRQPPLPEDTSINLNSVGPMLAEWMGLGRRFDPATILLLSVALYISAVALAAAAEFAVTRRQRRLRGLIAQDLQARLQFHLLSLSLAFFDQRRPGQVSQAFLAARRLVVQLLAVVFRGLLESGVQIAVYGFLLLRTSRGLAATIGGARPRRARKPS
jgi:ABC-type multidrug transport system fused ATPase/permease subunit